MVCSQVMKDALDDVINLELSIVGKPIDKKPATDLDEFIELHDEIKEAIHEYTMDSFVDINKNYLKGIKDANLEKLFSYEGNYYGKSYRGTHLDSRLLSQLEEGDLIGNRMPLSSTRDEYSAEMYIRNRKSNRKSASKVIIEIDNKNVPQYDISKYAELDEEEVLISPESLLQVQDIVKKDGLTIIKATTVHKDIQEMLADKAKQIKNLMSLTGGLIATERMSRSEEN